MRTPGNSTPVFQRSIGRTVENRDISLFSSSEKTGGTLLIGGIHGDEKGTVAVLESFFERWSSGDILLPSPVYFIPLANPDGFVRATRYNVRGVDLNRNWETNWSAASVEPSGPAPWSEPETRALRDFILEARPSRVVSLHWALAEVDADGEQSRALAQKMWEALPESSRAVYRVVNQEPSAEPCPGSLGQWCGYALRYPDGSAPAMVTLELPYDPLLPRPAILPVDHLETLRRAWKADHRAYLAALEAPVHRMLLAACDEG